jgi:hypothetical protein
MFLFLVSIIGQIQGFLFNMDPAFLDIVKIFAGSVAWFGGFILFVRMKERNRKLQPSVIPIESTY